MTWEEQSVSERSFAQTDNGFHSIREKQSLLYSGSYRNGEFSCFSPIRTHYEREEKIYNISIINHNGATNGLTLTLCRRNTFIGKKKLKFWLTGSCWQKQEVLTKQQNWMGLNMVNKLQENCFTVSTNGNAGVFQIHIWKLQSRRISFTWCCRCLWLRVGARCISAKCTHMGSLQIWNIRDLNLQNSQNIKSGACQANV